MPNRLRLYDFRVSDGPGLVGLCREDVRSVANVVNKAQRRLIFAKEAGDEGWHGSWAEILMMASRATPFVTLPREIARLEAVDVCERPIQLNNQFFEYLRFGNGRLPKTCHRRVGNCITEGFARNNAVTFVDPPTQPFFLQAFPMDPADVQANARVLFQGKDEGGNVIYSQDANDEVSGEYVTLASPFVQATHQFSVLNGIQKDVTAGAIQIMSVDVTTGVSTLLLTMEPSEQVADYRRYYFNRLPNACCPQPNQVNPQLVPVTAIAKLELVPAMVDTDYLLIQNLEALIEEAQSARFAGIDGTAAKQESRERHNAAVQLLNAELVHYNGVDEPAVQFKPFGNASFNRVTTGFR